MEQRENVIQNQSHRATAFPFVKDGVCDADSEAVCSAGDSGRAEASKQLTEQRQEGEEFRALNWYALIRNGKSLKVLSKNMI